MDGKKKEAASRDSEVSKEQFKTRLRNKLANKSDGNAKDEDDATPTSSKACEKRLKNRNQRKKLVAKKKSRVAKSMKPESFEEQQQNLREVNDSPQYGYPDEKKEDGKRNEDEKKNDNEGAKFIANIKPELLDHPAMACLFGVQSKVVSELVQDLDRYKDLLRKLNNPDMLSLMKQTLEADVHKGKKEDSQKDKGEGNNDNAAAESLAKIQEQMEYYPKLFSMVFEEHWQVVAKTLKNTAGNESEEGKEDQGSQKKPRLSEKRRKGILKALSKHLKTVFGAVCAATADEDEKCSGSQKKKPRIFEDNEDIIIDAMLGSMGKIIDNMEFKRNEDDKLSEEQQQNNDSDNEEDDDEEDSDKYESEVSQVFEVFLPKINSQLMEYTSPVYTKMEEHNDLTKKMLNNILQGVETAPHGIASQALGDHNEGIEGLLNSLKMSEGRQQSLGGKKINDGKEDSKLVQPSEMPSTSSSSSTKRGRSGGFSKFKGRKHKH